MGKNWHDFQLLFLAGTLSLLVHILLSVLSGLIEPKVRRKRKQSPPIDREVIFNPFKKLNIRFFMAGSGALALTVLALAMVPCVAVFRSLVDSGDRAMIFKGAGLIIGMSFLMVGGLLYASRKGDFTELRSHQEKTQHE